MKKVYGIKQINITVSILLLFVAVFVMLFCSQSVAAEKLKSDRSSKAAPYIVDIALDSLDTPFLLDSEGHVWAFKKPLDREGLIRLPNLQNIKKIAPWIALDKDGRVFTWYFDKKTDWLGEYDLAAVYTRPQLVEGLNNITMVAYNDVGRFVVVRDNKDILEWSRLRERRFGIEGYTPIKKLCTREGVKAIDAKGYGTSVLFRDGTILGWGLNEFRQTRTELVNQQISFNAPRAAAVYLNNYHTVVLMEDGRVLFWGGCSSGDARSEGKGILPADGIVAGVAGPIKDVISVIMPENDNFYPNIFLKRDGSVWRVYPPIPPAINKIDCKSELSGKSWQVRGMSVPAIAVREAAGMIMALGSDHTLWSASTCNYNDNKFNQIHGELSSNDPTSFRGPGKATKRQLLPR
jgi:hypothetical protein